MFRATTDRMLESSFSRVRFVYLVQGKDRSNVRKLIFKSLIHFLGSRQRLIERWKAHFQEFDSFSWFRATTDRMLESSFSRVRFVFLVQGNDWSSVGKLIFKSSIRLLGSGQRLIERWKARFQEFDSFSWFRATTDRALESSFSRVRFVFLVQGNDWSNVGKLVFKSSIRFLGSGQRLIECWKAHFQEFDSFSWFRATTDRMLESSFSSVRFVFLVQGKDWSNVGKLVFKSSIRFLGSGQWLLECWKARFQEFDSFSWFRARTDRMLESSFSRVRFVFLVQGNDWSNVGKLVFKSSIRFLGSGQRLIECWKARFQEFDSFSWFRATTDRMLESSFSRVRFVFLVQGKDWSSVRKLVFKSSIRLLGSGQRLIECWKAHFQEFDSFSWFKATTDRMLESSFSRVRFVFLVQGNDWSNVGKLVFKSSIRFLGSVQGLIECWKARFQEFDSFSWFRQRLIECWKAHFQEFDSFSWFRATTDRMLESSFSRVRFVFLVQSNDWSNVGKLIFKSSIRFLGSGQRLIECWKARFQEFDSFSWFRATTDRMLESSFQEFDSFSWFRATTDRMLESSFSRVRFVFLVQGKDWSSVGKLIFKSSIRLICSGQRLIECWKARFQNFDSFSWFRATTDGMLKCSFSRVRFVYLVQSNDWSNVGKLVFKSSIRLLGSGQRLIECWKAHFQEFDSFLGSGQKLIELWKAHFQEFDSFSWFRATTDRMLESSFSRVWFVFLFQGNDWSNVGKLIFKSSIRFLGSGQRLIECWKARFQEFDSFTWFRARTDRMLESSFSRVRFVFLVQGNDWLNVGKLIFKSSIRFLGSGQRLIECWKAHFQEFDSFSWFRARTDRMLERSFSRVWFVFLVQGNNWSNVGKLIFKSLIRFLGSGQRLIECWKAHFQEFDSFSWFRAMTDRMLESSFSRIRFVSWFRATTDRMLESSFSRVRFVFLVQGNNWSNVGKLVFKSSIRFLGSGQRLIECWKTHFQEFDSFSWFRATTDRMLESSFSRVRFVYLVQGNHWSNVGKLVFKSSIRFLGSGQRLIECWKAHFQEFDSFSWFRATTDRMLESSFSRVRFVFLVQGNDWSNVGKLIFKSSISLLWSGQRLIECWKARFQEFDSFTWFRARTDRMLENSFSRVRFVFLVQGNDWSNVGKLIFKSSIRFLGSGQQLIECWKAHFQEFDSFSWFRATTDRMLESSFSRVRFVFLVQGNDWSNVGKLIFKSSIRFLGSGQRLIECWKAHFQEFDSFTWFRAMTDRMLESSFSRVRFVFLVQGNDWSNVGKLIFKSSIRFLGSGQGLIECWKTHFQEFDSFSWFRATTDRMLESSFSRVRLVYYDQGNNWSNVGKLVFKSSIRLLGSGQGLIECWKAHFQEFDSFSWFRATTDRMLESSFSRVRFVFLVQGNNWSNVGKLIFKSSIRFLGSGQRLIECWKARFQEFDSFSWFRATTDRALESSFSRIRFIYLVQGNDWSSVGKLVFKSSIRFLGSGQWLIERWKAHFQEFDSFSWFRATTDRALESSFSRVRFVFLVQGNDWSSVGKLIFKSSIRFLGSGQRLIECWKAHFQEFDSFSWFRATTDRALESSFSRVRFVFLVQGNDWSNVGNLLFKSSIRFLGSEQWLVECWKARFQEFDSFSWFRATTDRALESSFSRVRFVFLVQGNDWSNVGKLIFKSSIRFLGSGQRLIECWKARFQEFDSFTLFRATTDRMLESSFSRVRFVYLVQGKDWSNVGKLIFKSSIRFLGSGQWLIECWKAHFQEFDSFSWFRATTDRMLESSFSRVRFVFLVQGNDWSNVGKLIFKSSIRLLGSGQRLIERWKAHFQEFDSFSWFRATTDRMLESSFSRVRFVFLVQGNDWSSVGKLIFKSSIRLLGSRQRLIEPWKARFQEFNSFSWFRATTDRALESSFSRVRFVFLVQGNDWSSVGKLIFKSSIHFLGSGQRLIECWKAHFQEFDSFSWFRATTDRMLESSFSSVRFVFLVQGNDWSNVGKLVFKSSIRFLGSGQGLLECWKARFQEFDSFSWFRARTDRMLESSFSRVRFVYLVQGNDWSNVGKLVFKSSIRFLGSGQRLIECWKARFQEFDSFTLFRATTDRMLESSFSRVRFVFLVQGKDWSSVRKLIFKSSIRLLGSGQRLIECWKARFQEFDSFSWFKAKTDRMLESSFSRVRFVFLVQGNDWSNVGKLIFKSSIRFLVSGQRLIECWKAHFQEFDSFSWFRATTDRMLESSFSRVRFVFLVQGNDWSNVGKLIFKSSIRFLGSEQRLIECWKAHFQEFDSFSWFRATTDRMLESSFSRVRFVFLVQGNDWSNVGKFFSRVRFVFLVEGKDWSNVGKLVFKSSIRFLGSGQGLIERLKAHFQEFNSFILFRATTDRMLESSFSRVRFVFLVQGNDWSNVKMLVFKSSIRLLGSKQRLIECWKAHFQEFDSFLGSGQRLIECWKARFQEFDSFTWFRATTDRMLESSFSRVRFVSWFRAKTDRALESSFSRVRFVFLVQGKDWSNVGKLVFKSSIRFLVSGQRLIECWKAHFQEFDSFSWFRATTDRMLESSFSRVRFVYLVQGKDWSNVGKLVFKSSIRFLGSGQRLIECWKTHFQEFDSFSWFRATTDRMLESSFSRVWFVFLVQGNDWSNVGKLIFKSLIRFLGSGQWLIECWKARFQEFDSFSWFRATTDRMLESSFSRVRFVFLVQGNNWSNVGKLVFKSSIRFLVQGNDWSNVGKLIFKSSIRFLGSGQRLIECWKAHFQEFDSFSWFRATTDRMLESSFSRVRFVYLVQGNDWSNVGKLVFKSSIRFLGSGQRLIECWKAQFSRVRFVFLVQGKDWSNVGKLIFKSSIRFLGSGQRLIECWKAQFSRVRFVFLVQGNDWSNVGKLYDQGNDWSNVGKLVFKSSIRLLGSGQGLIECWKAHFQEFDSFSWFRATTDRMLESSFSRVRFVFLVQGNNWSNVGKLIFKSSIRFLGSGQRLIECWKARFQEFDSFSWFRATTDRALESSFSRIRFIYLVQGNDWSSVGKLIFKSSIRFLGSGQRLIERWKAHFQEFDSFSWFRATTDRALESSFSRVRFVFLVQGNDWSSVGKLIFKSSIRFLGSGQRLIECWKAHFQEFDSFSWFRATTDQMLESSFSRVRFVFLVQGNDWSNVGNLLFKSSIRFLGSEQRLVECWKAHFQKFDSFSWFRATTDRMLESSFSRVRFVFLVQGNDWSNVGKLIFKSSIRFLGSGQRLIECWKARFQEFNSFTLFRATTDRMLESSFSRVRFVFLVQGKDWSNVGKLIFKSSIRFLGSGQWLIECWKAHFQVFDSFSRFRATTDRMLESSFSRVRFVFLVQGNDWSNVGKLIFKSSIRFLGSGQRLIECWKARFQEFD